MDETSAALGWAQGKASRMMTTTGRRPEVFGALQAAQTVEDTSPCVACWQEASGVAVDTQAPHHYYSQQAPPVSGLHSAAGLGAEARCMKACHWEHLDCSDYPWARSLRGGVANLNGETLSESGISDCRFGKRVFCSIHSYVLPINV